jgi:RimJ/RimL family protein N-acetyltransferase
MDPAEYCLIESDVLIGDVGIWLSENGATAQIGYSCSPSFQRQGFATEAVRMTIEALSRYAACETVRAIVDSRNIGSERLLLRLSFKQVARTAMMEGKIEFAELTYERRLRV